MFNGVLGSRKGASSDFDDYRRSPYVSGGKRRVSRSDGSDCVCDCSQARYGHARNKRPKTSLYQRSWEEDISFAMEKHGSLPLMQPFLVIREQSSTLSESAIDDDPASCPLERTESGLSISSDSAIYTTTDHEDASLLKDEDAAQLVDQHLASYCRKANGSRAERILRSLIRPRSRDAEFTIDNDALESIFSAANEIFFSNRLTRRVAWDWSHSSSSQYDTQVIGTTAIRRCKLLKGFETLIVLSQPILNNKKYNRRLLISTFLHELIHSYLFVCCGFAARECGGHTRGFKHIAALIDSWAGPDTLHLRNMEADLDDFKEAEDENENKGNDPIPRPLSSLSHNILLDDVYENTVSHQNPPRHESQYSTPFMYRDEGWETYVTDRQEHITMTTAESPPPTPFSGDCIENIQPAKGEFIRGICQSRPESPIEVLPGHQQWILVPRHPEHNRGFWDGSDGASSLSASHVYAPFDSPYVH